MCPPEVTSHIFNFACTDDGQTARSLCVVSKYIHGVATPFIWRTISISGLSRLQLFASRLDLNPSRARYIEDIFLSDRSEADAAVPWSFALAKLISNLDGEAETREEAADLEAT
jgi:hypothetical protein